MAPTTEHDFVMLPDEKRQLYQAVQRAHLHGSPDGPWFFIVARSHPDEGLYELLGITDTSMLRPQVFALYENDVQIGLIASERQAINACLRSLAEEDERFQPVADRYWVARGGSHTDGGAFRFTYSPGEGLSCANKFGTPVALEPGLKHVWRGQVQPQQALQSFRQAVEMQALHAFDNGRAPSFWRWLKLAMPAAGWDELAWMLDWMGDFARNGGEEWRFAADVITLLRDRRYDTGAKKRASILGMVDRSLVRLFDQTPTIKRLPNDDDQLAVARLTWDSRQGLRPPQTGEILLLDTLGFPPEGDESAARWLVQARQMGWRHLVAYNWRGGRFAACGFGPDSQGTRVDLYGDVGDYAGSGLDGAEVHLHGDGQDQMGQILKRGKLVVHGDVGQTFLYGAKGGEIYVLGSAAGRPLINAVGRPRAIINGTCLDYLAESFMAGDPLHDGGFVILNGVAFDDGGHLRDLPSSYPGGNLFSLGSGGAIYLRDPYLRVDEDQLNGGAFAELDEADWTLIEPYLRENERLFDIAVDDLLKVEGNLRAPQEVYRKIEVRSAGVLRETGLTAETENR